MPYIFGKLWHLAIIWAIRKAFQCILQCVRILLANHTRISPTSENDSYPDKEMSQASLVLEDNFYKNMLRMMRDAEYRILDAEDDVFLVVMLEVL